MSQPRGAPIARRIALVSLLLLAVAAAVWQLQQQRQEAAAQVERAAAATRGRAVPVELLALPRAPVQDELGYHSNDTDKLALIALLQAKRYAELEALLEKLWAETRSDVRNEYRLADAYLAFRRDDAALRPLVEAWIAARPAALEANLAAAIHYQDRAQTARGTKFAADTSAEQFAAMEQELEHARRYLRKARQREPDHLMGFATELALRRFEGWSDEVRELVRQSLAANPQSFYLRASALEAMEPRWGGSYEEMEAFAEAAQVHAGANPRLRCLLGYADAERAFTWHRNGDDAQARALFAKALEHGPDGSFLRERADLMLEAGDPLQAAQDAQRALLQRPQSVPSLSNKAESLFWLALMAPAAQREQVLHAAFDHFDLLRSLEPGETRWQEWLDYILYARKTCMKDPLACGCRSGKSSAKRCATVRAAIGA